MSSRGHNKLQAGKAIRGSVAGSAVESERLSPELLALLGSALQYTQKARAASTKATYEKQWAAFKKWCERKKTSPLPASDVAVAAYLADRANAGRRPATIALGLAAIAVQHQKANHPSPATMPLVRETWKGIRNKLGTAPKQKAPATIDVVRSMIETLPAGRLGARDRAVLSLGFAGGFRRSELAALNCSDVRTTVAGLDVVVRKSKTDQMAKGMTKAIRRGRNHKTCPVRALQDWLEVARIARGPLFRPIDRHGNVKPRRLRAQDVASIVKRAAVAAGLDPQEFSGHSLRAGFVTTAKARGAQDAEIMKVTGHQTPAMVHTYNRVNDRWKDPASGLLGL
jgi:integrase